MAVESPPWALNAGTYTAEQTRRAVFSWAGRTAANTPGIVSGGLYSSTDCQATAPGSGLSANISIGEILIPGTEGGVQGPGYGRVSSTTNVAIATANASNPRIDIVCATMSDAQYTEPTGGSGSQWALQAVTGTPTVGATLTNLSGAPTLPLSSLLLCYVLVPASAANIITADIANKATVVNLGAPGLNYLQLLSAQTAQVAFGSSSVSFTTGNSNTATVNIAHGLGRTPQSYVAFMDVRTVTTAIFVMQTASIADSTNLHLYGVTSSSPGSNFSEPFNWIAVG